MRHTKLPSSFIHVPATPDFRGQYCIGKDATDKGKQGYICTIHAIEDEERVHESTHVSTTQVAIACLSASNLIELLLTFSPVQVASFHQDSPFRTACHNILFLQCVRSSRLSPGDGIGYVLHNPLFVMLHGPKRRLQVPAATHRTVNHRQILFSVMLSLVTSVYL